MPGAPNAILSMAVDARNGNIWVSTGYTELYLYNGTSWEQKINPSSFDISSIAVAPNGDIYITDGTKLYRSTNGGSNWNDVFTIPVTGISSILITGSGNNYNVYLLANNGTIFIPNGSGSWVPTNLPLGAGTATSLACSTDGTTLYAGNSNGPYIVYRSIDGGNNWTALSLTNDFRVLQLAFVNNNTIFAVSDGFGSDAGIYKSTDAGGSWTKVTTYNVNHIIYNSTTGHIFAISSINVYRSTNLGASWEDVSAGIPGSWAEQALAYDPNTGQTYIGTNAGSVYRSLTHMVQIGIQTTPQSGDTLNFGDVQSNTSSTQNITIQNSGNANLIISQATISGTGFTLQNVTTPIIIPASTSHNIEVQFLPATATSHTGTVTLTHNASGSPTTINLTGTGTLPNITISPTLLDFGSVEIGDFFEHTLSIKNNGNATLVISSISLPDDFTLPNGESTINIEPDDEYELKVQFTPTEGRVYSGDLTLTHNAGSPTTVPLSGTGIIFVVDITPEHIDFGTIRLGTPKDTIVTITNTGTGDITITNAIISGNDATSFLHDFNRQIILKPNETKKITVTFNPNTLGKKNGLLTVNHSIADQDSLSVTLTGTGEGPVINIIPFVLEFKDVLIDSTNTKTLTISNDGDLDLEIKSFTLTGEDVSRFTLVSEHKLPITIEPSKSVDLTLQFLPTSIGEKSANLEIIHNDHTSPSIVQLTGRGVAPNIIATPNPLNFGDVTIRTSFFRNITIQNSGTADLIISEVSIDGAMFTLLNATTPIIVVAGERRTIAIHFYPVVVGDHSGYVTLTHNASLSNGENYDTTDPENREGSPNIVQLTGNGIPPLTPGITINSNPFAFGDVLINSSKTESITIENHGSADLQITNIFVSGNSFTLQNVTTPITVTAGGSRNIEIQFLPTVYGSHTGTITFTHNAPTAGTFSTILLSGTGVAPVAPRITINTTSLNFDNVQINQSKNLTVIISNTGNANLEISSITTTGTNASLFTVVGNSTNITVNPNARHTATVRFTPDALGQKTATLQISTNVGNETISLIGTGTPTISVDKLDEIPNTYNLMQNYPNPFNPTTKIQYSLPEASYVRLSVYNSIGQEVMQLVNETQSAGKYIIDFNAQNLQSGVYLYRLQTSKFVDTKKMLLLK